MDYRLLLKKYMEHVGTKEGSYFLPDGGQAVGDNCGNEMVFSHEEAQALADMVGPPLTQFLPASDPRATFDRYADAWAQTPRY